MSVNFTNTVSGINGGTVTLTGANSTFTGKTIDNTVGNTNNVGAIIVYGANKALSNTEVDIIGTWTDGVQPIHLVSGVNMNNNIVLSSAGGATEPWLLATGSALPTRVICPRPSATGILPNGSSNLATADVRLGDGEAAPPAVR